MTILLDIPISIADTLFHHGVVAVTTMAAWLAIAPEDLVIGTAGLVAVAMAVKLFPKG